MACAPFVTVPQKTSLSLLTIAIYEALYVVYCATSAIRHSGCSKIASQLFRRLLNISL